MRNQSLQKISLSRRQWLRALALAGIAMGSSYAWQLFRTADDESPLMFTITLPNIDSADFEVFFALSKIITARATLDEKAARKLYPVFMNEPWGKQHIVSCYKKLLVLLDTSKLVYPPYTDHVREKLSDSERWFISHLLITWYVGIYYHESAPAKRILYQQALMFESLQTDYPIPFIGKTGYGGWVTPPTT